MGVSVLSLVPTLATLASWILMDAAGAHASWYVSVDKHSVKTSITVRVRVNAAGASSSTVAGAVLLVQGISPF